MRCFLSLFLAVLLPLLLTGATRKPARKPVAKAASGKARQKVAVHGKTTGAHAQKGRRGKATVHSAPVEHSQAAPTSDRFREIQEALVSKGYLKSEPTGIWDADSQDAMRRYQSDQKLDQTGKINSLSLISLGLGPKH